MLFNSYEFLFFFLPCFLLIYYITPERHRTFVLTFAGYVFYAGWKPAGVPVLFGATLINYWMGKLIYGAAAPARRKLFCAASVAANLLILGFFKYTGFFEQTVNGLVGRQVLTPIHIALPIGISFYLFQCISYTVDLYRGRVKPTRNFLDFACYVSLFPHLVAGPILRYSFMEKQLVHREYSSRRFAEGIAFFIVGLAKKVLIADTLGVAAAQLFETGNGGTYACWAGLIAYTLQIFYDFSGYSDMAIGLGRFIGFNIPQNFNSPYMSVSISEFWRRWHMSLSYWLRDFLYIPLGGSRLGSLRTYLNLFITMLLGGLWHGASWTFVFWGAYHGILLAIERLLGSRNPVKRLPVPLQIVFTNFLVMIGWAFFRADTFGKAISIISGLFGGQGDGATAPFLTSPGFVATALAGIFLLLKWENIYERKWRFTPVMVAILICGFIACAVLVMTRHYSPFLYVQF